jgi:hypothetical protein
VHLESVSRLSIGRFTLEGGEAAELVLERVVEPFWSPHRRDAIRLVIDTANPGVRAPCVRGVYFPNDGLLQIEEIGRGCVAPGQRFTEGALGGLRQLIPEITTMRFANVTHPMTRDLIEGVLGEERRVVIPNEALKGPLLFSLAGVGCSPIYGEREGFYLHATGVLASAQALASRGPGIG